MNQALKIIRGPHNDGRSITLTVKVEPTTKPAYKIGKRIRTVDNLTQLRDPDHYIRRQNPELELGTVTKHGQCEITIDVTELMGMCAKAVRNSSKKSVMGPVEVKFDGCVNWEPEACS